MSADLLAEFGQPSSSTAEVVLSSGPQAGTELQNDRALIPDVSDLCNRPTPIESKIQPLEEPLWHRNKIGTDVLFDASTDQYNPSEDFGDFEGEEGEALQDHGAEVHQDAAHKQALPVSMMPVRGSNDLKDADPFPDLMSEEDGLQHHDEEWGEFSTATPDDGLTDEGSSGPNRPSGAQLVSHYHVEPKPQVQELDVPSNVAQGIVNSQQPVSSVHPDGSEANVERGRTPRSAKAVPNVSAHEIRPIYVPPPAVLLQILPDVFANLISNSQLPSAAQVSDSIVKTYRVSGRLIAGRNLRWKRDTILSQSTKIGPAGRGGKGGGMKLATIDRSESLKEEREVADALQAWNRLAPSFKSMVGKAQSRQGVMRLSDQMRPRAGKGLGILTAPYPCILCGLKRDERVSEIDVSVEDSFGEFWIEHWGHADCQEFWCLNQTMLPRR